MKEFKAYSSRVGEKVDFDYPLAFSDCQELQKLHKRLVEIAQALDSNLAIVKGLRQRCNSLAERGEILRHCPLAMELENQGNEIQGYLRIVKGTLENSEGALQLVSQLQVHERRCNVDWRS